MSMCTRGVFLAMALTVLAACTPVSPPAPVQLEGEPTPRRRLVGTWEGEFHNVETGRAGKIYLDLAAATDTAYGYLTFDRVIPINFCTDMSRPEAPSQVVMPVVLRLGRLAVGKRGVSGWVLPYWDPDLGCWMDTWFRGGLTRDTLRGVFFSRRTDIDSVRSGEWWASRVR